MPYIPTMPKNRILPALVVAALIPLAAWAQAPTPPATPAPAGSVAAATAPEPPTEAELQLDEAIKKVTALKSVSADLVQKVEMLDQKFEVKGRYLKAPDHRVYLRLDVKGLPDAEGTTLQVCDGKTLWEYQRILDSQVYRRIEVGQVFEKLQSPDLDETVRAQITSQLGFAGPEELLTGLRKSVKFDQKESGTLDGQDVWVLRGTWKNREGLVGPNQQPLPPTVPLPAYMPSLVSVTIGKENGWPYKVLLVGKRPTVLLDLRKRDAAGNPMGRPTANQDVKVTRMDLSYVNVKLNPELNVDEFVFSAPPNVKPQDDTESLLAGLDQAIQVRAAQKKQEAARVDGDLLNQPINVPRVDEKATEKK